MLPILCALAAAAHAADPSVDTSVQPLTTTVLDFQCSGPEFQNKGVEAAKILAAQLSAMPNITVVQRQELDNVLGAREFAETENVDEDVATRISRLTGAEVLVTGRIISAQGKNYVVAKIVSAETGQVYGEIGTFDKPEDLDAAMLALAPKVIKDFEKRTATLVKREDVNTRLARLRKLVQGRKLPSVSVEIAQSQTEPPSTGPAAQDQIKQVLKDVGFQVVDGTNSKAAQLTISGRAFSEVTGRRGKLISCRARVELRISKPGAGGVVLADRQTDLAVGDAENIAGKSALASSATKLLDRVIPMLVASQDDQGTGN